MATLPVESESGCFCGDGTEPSSIGRKIRGRRKEGSNDNVDDAALAKEINELTIEERNHIAKEICGVAEEIEESPEFIASCLEQMDISLAKVSHAKRKDFDRAVFLKPSIPNDNSFKLMFLRCDKYNAKKAATRMANYFTLKRELFGEYKLAKKITLDDLDESDIEAGQAAGMLFRLPQADRAGRPVVFIDISQSRFHSSKSLNRWSFHLIMGALETNEAAQKKGIAVVIFCPGTKFVSERLPSPSRILGFFKGNSALKHSLPFRLSSGHYCYDNPLTQFIMGLFRGSTDKDARLRLQTHFGSATEIRYSLRSFGILTDGIIVSQGEEDEKPILWQQYLESRLEVEQQEQEDIAAEAARIGIVSCATRNDVLLGSGRSYQQFPGNQRFRELLDKEMARYKACLHLFEKSKILKELIQEIHDSGGQFLRRVTNGWEIAEEEVAKEKIRKYFRSKPRGGLPALISSPSSEYNGLSDRSSKRLKIDPYVGMPQG